MLRDYQSNELHEKWPLQPGNLDESADYARSYEAFSIKGSA